MGSIGIVKLKIMACQRQRTGNQNCKNRNGEYRTLNLQWRNTQLSGNVNQTPNNTNSTTSNNKTSIEKVAQLDGKNYAYSLPADPQLPNTTQDYQQNTQSMIETPTVTNSSEFGLHFQKVEYSSIVGLMFDIHHFDFYSSDCLFFEPAVQQQVHGKAKNTDNNHRINKYTECKKEFKISQKSTEHL
jgi:hypothetical protein